MSTDGFADDRDAFRVMNNPAATSFYSAAELADLGLSKVGENVLISRKASLYAPDKIEIGNNVRIDDFCILSASGGIKIGSYIHIAPYCALFGASGIELWDFSTLSGRVSLYSESDDSSGESLANPMIPETFKPAYRRGKIVVDRHAIIGTNSTVLPGVTLGEGASIGAHSLVLRNCEPWTVYFGVPAKRIKERSRNVLTLERQFMEYTRAKR